MAYYAALVSLVQLLEEIIHGDQYRKFHLDRNQIDSVYGKFSLLQTLLGDYSPKDELEMQHIFEETADGLERRIRDTAYQAQNIIEYQISRQVNHGMKSSFWSLISTPRQPEDLERVKEEVGSIVEGIQKFGMLRFLNEDESWNLFSERVICPPELEDIGRSIANNCRGLPLAIVVVAGILSKVNKRRDDWEAIARNVSSIATEKDEDFSKILSLSYNHLPHHLKPCFLYLGGFPEDYEICVSTLINLWIAEGFLKPFESKSLEELAEEYLEDLVSRSLVLITKKKSNGKFKYCIIHDLLRGLCLQRALHENFLHNPSIYDGFNPIAIRNVHRLHIHSNFFILKSQVKRYCSTVRSIIFLCDDWDNILSVAFGFKLLRVLDTVNVRMSSFPDEIVELVHLRYLALPNTIVRVPPQISKLQNLQTLIIASLWSSTEIYLPPEIWKMSYLKHVIIKYVRMPPIPSAARTELEAVHLLGRLETLSRVVNLKFTTKTIEMILSLKKLKVSYTYEQREMWQEFCLNNLVYLCELETLDIEFYPGFRRLFLPIPLPESFAFPLKLKKLSLDGCALPWKDMTAVGSLPNLQVLKLRNKATAGEEWEPIQGEFPRLKFMLMEKLDLKYWRAESAHFARLEHLRIRYCDKLEEIPPETGEIPTLELIEVHGSKLAADSAMKIQQEKRDLGNDALQARIHDHQD